MRDLTGRKHLNRLVNWHTSKFYQICYVSSAVRDVISSKKRKSNYLNKRTKECNEKKIKKKTMGYKPRAVIKI